ncbi:hypothetical protein ABR737_26860 [Streptomyces sp. Edi2]|uniref:hypothetical protein n=1 Tax=Streptomyces sp. Edi2 TaxID=3162528 RepID=UPI003306472E
MTATTAPAAADPDVGIVRPHDEARYWCGAARSPLTIPPDKVTPRIGEGMRVRLIVGCLQHRHRRSQ